MFEILSVHCTELGWKSATLCDHLVLKTPDEIGNIFLHILVHNLY